MNILKSVGVLTAGNIAAQAINLIGFMYLSRIYTPAEIGVYAVLIGISSIIGVVSSCRYEMTILLPKSERNAWLAVKASLLVSIFIFLIVAGSLFLLSKIFVFSWLNYWLVISILSLCFSIININSFICTREELYKFLGYIQISRSLMFVGFSVVFYELKVVTNGLFLSSLITGLVLVFFLISIQYRRLAKISSFTRMDILKIWVWLRRYKDFLNYSTPAVFFSSAVSQAPVMMLSAFYGDFAAGYYSLIEKIIIRPIGIISGAVNKVYTRNVASMIANREKIFSFSFLLIKKMTGLSIVAGCCMTLLFIYDGLELIFGNQWVDIDKYAATLVSVFVIGSLSKCVAGFAVLGKNKLGLIYQIVLFMSVISSISVSYYLGVELLYSFVALSCLLTLAYSVQIISILIIIKDIDRRSLNEIL